MSLENFSYIIAIILLLSSIISPIITALINNNHQAHMKRIEIFENDKKLALAEFIKNAQQVAYNPNDPEIELAYASSFNNLFLYFSDVSIEMILPFDELRAKIAKTDKAEDFQQANRELSNIVQVLSKQIAKE